MGPPYLVSRGLAAGCNGLSFRNSTKVDGRGGGRQFNRVFISLEAGTFETYPVLGKSASGIGSPQTHQ